MSTFSKENESYLRSLGYSGTRFDAPRDESLTEKNKFLYDTITKAAGDDGQLTKDEYESIYSVSDRGPWGKYAYNSDSVRDALARAAIDSGFTIDQDTLDRHDLTYDGDDLLGKFEAGDYAPSYKDKDKYSYERTIDDDDDRWNVFRYRSNKSDPAKEENVNTPEPEDQAPLEPEAPEQMQGSDQLNMLRKKYDYFGHGRGSIDYNTPYMSSDQGDSDRYQPSILDGKFSDYIFSNNKYKEGKQRAGEYKDQSRFL
tara:strand:+ start:1236 stop:2003 length:768 start_codon:yes stop_codon:yes gene_type:complete